MKLSYLFFVFVAFGATATEQNHQHSASTSVSEQVTGKKVPSAKYVCPMHSHIVKDHPGKCPICGMDLVPFEAPESADEISVNVSGHTQQSMALTTEKVERSTLWRFIETFGAVEYNENGLTHIHPRATGWVENLKVKTLGEKVKKGQLLYEIYAPELIVAQDDYLSLLKTNPNNQGLKQRGRTRLELLGFTDALIKQLETSRQSMFRVPYYAPHDAVVSELSIREGMYVNPANKLMTLADLSKVWVLADVFEHQIDWVENGKWVEFDLPAIGVYAAEGKIEYIYPALDAKTRTLKVRLSLENNDGKFKPEMIANVRIYGGPKKDTLNIPVEALIRTGKENRVVVQLDDNAFVSRSVMVGTVTQGRAEILQGLAEGDKVVTSGQFLIDSESNIRSAILKMGQDAAMSGHNH
jgi:Cu(I)/Ag(I) efflux system membrane fusion protein